MGIDSIGLGAGLRRLGEAFGDLGLITLGSPLGIIQGPYTRPT